MPRVTLAPDGPSFDVAAGEDILGAARRAGVWLPFECGWGSCSTCKATLLEGDVALLFAAAPAVSERDVRRKRIIVCQSTPLTDVVIKPQSFAPAPPPERPTVDRVATLVDVEDLGPALARFTFEADAPIAFRAGQYAILDFGNGLKRCYSMAAPPAGRRLTVIAKDYARPGSAALFGLTRGDRIDLCAPFGDMWLRDDPGPVILLAGGTGISAILALAAELALRRDPRPLRIFYGAGSHAELVCRTDLERCTAALSDADIRHVLERPPADWPHDTGFVTDALERRWLVADGARYYLAGPPAMVDATLAVLARLGVGIDRIHYDRFG